MKIRYLRIRINTDKGLHGTDIEFPDGLVVLRADNSMGKSTCLQSILVALGLEAMLTTSQRDLPLPHAMKKELFSNADLATVLESDVFLELENKDGESIVVHRTVKGKRDKNLVTVIFGPALTNSFGHYSSEDFFVARSGAATRERGFHRFLAGFFGWELPEVQTYDNRQSLLYLQCIFPFVMVEQKRGWSSLIPLIPTRFRIRELHKRVVEFLLNLDAYTIAVKRIELSGEEKEIENEWSFTIREIQAMGRIIGGVIGELPKKPVTKWPPEIMPQFLVPYEDEWITLEDLLQVNTLELKRLIEEDLPRVSEIAQTAEAELSMAQEQLREKEVILSQLLNSLQMEKGDVRSIQIRLEKLGEDIQRNKDVKTLLSLGSSSISSIARNICPTCHQPMEDTLLPLAEEQNVMSIDDNINFLEEQQRTFTAALRNAEKVVAAHEIQVMQLREEFTDERSRIRTLRETLVSDGRLPSMEAIRKRVALEESVTRKSMLLEQFQIKLGELEPLSQRWFDVQCRKAELPDEDTSTQDKEKLKLWNALFQEQLVKYDFQSLSSNSVIISEDTYTPAHEGFDLPSNISASDFIRVIWAYLNGLLEVSREFQTNHPGFLIFDEPKQQSTKNMSFAALLERASISAEHNQQIIFATSENKESIKRILENIPHKFVEFEGRIIQPLPGE